MKDVPARDVTSQGPWSKNSNSVSLPAEWAWQFEPGSVEYYPAADGANPSLFGVATFASRLRQRVKFGTWRTADERTNRQVKMLEHLRETGAVPRILDTVRHPDNTYVLTEWPSKGTLGDLIERWEASKPPAGAPLGEPIVPLDRALPLMIDMLETVKRMSQRGVVHGDLTEWNIHIVDERGAVVVDDLCSACLLNGDDQTSCANLHASFHGSAFHHAPEMQTGVPNDVANNVWQLGLIFARMLVGEVGPQKLRGQFDDHTALGRHYIRHHMYKNFDIWRDPRFARMYHRYGDVLQVVARMLEKDPRRRQTAEWALQSMIRVATTRGIPVP